MRLRDGEGNARATMGLRADGYAFVALVDGGGADSVVSAALDMDPNGQARVVVNGSEGMSAVLTAGGSVADFALGDRDDGRMVRLAAENDSAFISVVGPKADETRASMDLLFSKGTARLRVAGPEDAQFELQLAESVHGKLTSGGAVTGEFRWPAK